MLKPNYNPSEIITLARAINKNEEAYSWLLHNGFKELAALVDCFVYNNRKSYEWLVDFEYSFLITFIDAAHEDQDAFNKLMNSNAREWAATINASNGNQDAINWLLKYNFNHFVELAKCISHVSLLNSNNEDHYDEDVDEFSLYNFFSKIIRRSVRKKII
jgi:hypothetical protein